MNDNQDQTFFGHKVVSSEDKHELVKGVFTKVSSNYDIMNDLMSFGVHRVWKDIFCKQLDNPSAKLLDVAGGTGDISERFYNFAKENGVKPDINMCDINFDMLKHGVIKHCNKNILDVNYSCCNAEELSFANNTFDYYTVAFGIRNFTNIKQSLNEALRVLKPGGKFLCLEFSKPQNNFFGLTYKFYSQFFIPTLGSVIAGSRDSYQYLIESIDRFPSQQEFANIITESGFKNVSYRSLTNGVVAIHTAFKENV